MGYNPAVLTGHKMTETPMEGWSQVVETCIIFNIEPTGFGLGPDIGCAKENRVPDDPKTYFLHEKWKAETLVRGGGVGGEYQKFSLGCVKCECQLELQVEMARRRLFM